MRRFEIYSKWSVQTNQQTNKHTHTRAQCSHASVGLAQARPNEYSIDDETATQIEVNLVSPYIESLPISRGSSRDIKVLISGSKISLRQGHFVRGGR